MNIVKRSAVWGICFTGAILLVSPQLAMAKTHLNAYETSAYQEELSSRSFGYVSVKRQINSSTFEVDRLIPLKELPPQDKPLSKLKYQRYIMKITPQTLIWNNGAFVTFNRSSGLNSGDTIVPLIGYGQGDMIIAQKIYGPTMKAEGKVINVSGNIIILEEIRRNAPTGRTLKLMVTPDTKWNEATGVKLRPLKPGTYIGSAAVGRPPDILLAQGIWG